MCLDDNESLIYIFNMFEEFIALKIGKTISTCLNPYDSPSLVGEDSALS